MISKRTTIIILAVFGSLLFLHFANELLFKFEKHAPGLTLTIEAGETINRQLRPQVFRTSLTGNRYEIDDYVIIENKIRFFISKRYVKELELIFPGEPDLNSITCFVKNSSFSIPIPEDGNKVRITPAKMKYKGSLVPFFNRLLNWCGDFFLAFYILFYTLMTFAFSMAMFYYVKSEKRWIYWALIGFILLISILIRFFLPPVPVGSPDSSGYYMPAVNFAEGLGFKSSGRSFVYSFYLLFCLALTKNFIFISIIQHITGLAAGLLLLYTWNKMYYFFKQFTAKKYFYLMGIVIFIMYNFHLNVIRFEHSITREALFPIVYSLLAYLAVSACISLGEKKTRQTVIFTSALFFCNLLLYKLQPRWGLALGAVLILYLVLFIKCELQFLKKVLFMALLPVLLSGLLLIVPDKLYTKDSEFSTIFLPTTVLFWHFGIIAEEVEKDIADPAFSRYDKKMLNMVLEDFASIQGKSTKHSVLGFDPDLLMYGDTKGKLIDHFNGDLKQYKSFCYYYTFRGLLKHPVKYIHKVFRQMMQFYKVNMYDWENEVEVYRAAWSPGDHSSGIMKQYKADIDKARSRNIHLSYNLVVIMPVIYVILNIVYVPMVLVLIGILIFLAWRKELFNSLQGILGLLILFFISHSFFINLTCSMIHALETSRYIKEQYISILFSQFMLLYFITIFFISYFKKRKKKN